MTASELIDSHVSVDQCRRAVAALSKHASKVLKKKEETELLPNSEENVWLVLTVKKMQPERKLKPFKIPLKHGIIDPSTSSICLITKDPQREYKDLLQAHDIKFISRVVGITKLKGKFKGFEARRMLLKENAMFLADERVIPLLPGLLGRKFFDAKKQPIPVCLTRKDLKGELERAIQSSYMHQNQGTCTSVKIGTIAQTPEQILDNIQSALPAIVKNIKDGWENVQSFNIKTSSSVSLPLWTCELGKGDGARWQEEEATEAEEWGGVDGVEDESLTEKASTNAERSEEKGSDDEEEEETPVVKKQKTSSTSVSTAIITDTTPQSSSKKPKEKKSAPITAPAKVVYTTVDLEESVEDVSVPVEKKKRHKKQKTLQTAAESTIVTDSTAVPPARAPIPEPEPKPTLASQVAMDGPLQEKSKKRKRNKALKETAALAAPPTPIPTATAAATAGTSNTTLKGPKAVDVRMGPETEAVADAPQPGASDIDAPGAAAASSTDAPSDERKKRRKKRKAHAAGSVEIIEAPAQAQAPVPKISESDSAPISTTSATTPLINTDTKTTTTTTTVPAVSASSKDSKNGKQPADGIASGSEIASAGAAPKDLKKKTRIDRKKEKVTGRTVGKRAKDALVGKAAAARV